MLYGAYGGDPASGYLGSKVGLDKNGLEQFDIGYVTRQHADLQLRNDEYEVRSTCLLLFPTSGGWEREQSARDASQSPGSKSSRQLQIRTVYYKIRADARPVDRDSPSGRPSRLETLEGI